MTLTHEKYEDLKKSLLNANGNSKELSSQYITSKGMSLIFAMERGTQQRKFYFPIEVQSIKQMPRCKGLAIERVQLYEYSSVNYYCQIAQASDSEDYIYEVIVEDIRKNAEHVSVQPKLYGEVANVLLKWKAFFAQEKQVLMSPEKQQGLYGELLFLKQLIDEFGLPSLTAWTGYRSETHDFYLNKNAIEVKTTSAKAPYKMHISSEYQLDDKDLYGQLFVNFFAFRKSAADGKTLPTLVSEIRQQIHENLGLLNKFNDGLEAYGYYDGLEDKYTSGYYLREEHTYCVSEGFPRIIKSDLLKGVSGCTYDVTINDCSAYEVTQNDKFQMLKGSERFGR